MKTLPLALFIIPFLTGCGANNTPPKTPVPGEKPLPNYVPWKQARRLFNPDLLSMPSVPTLTGSIFIAVIKTDRWRPTITLPS